MTAFNRITLIVLDGAGIGAMPDAPAWGDAGWVFVAYAVCVNQQAITGS